MVTALQSTHRETNYYNQKFTSIMIRDWLNLSNSHYSFSPPRFVVVLMALGAFIIPSI
jgi:hypothetical protein